MDFSKRVLPRDLDLAKRLADCCVYCLHQSKAAFINGHFERADQLVIDYQKAKRDLDQLQEDKLKHDRLVSLLGSTKVDLERVIVLVRQQI